MAFGQELQDFVSGFKTGRDVVEDSLNREERKEDRDYTRKHTADRELISDTRYDTEWGHKLDREQFTDQRADEDRKHRYFREGVTDERDNQNTELERQRLQSQIDELKLRYAEKFGADGVGPDAMGDYLKNKGVGGGTATPSSAGGDQSAIPDSGYIQYANAGATRNQPLSPKLEQALSFLPEMGIQAKVFSGGQDATGSRRTGSHRHDAGGAGDVFFYKDGRKLDYNNPDDLPYFEEIVRRGKQAGLTGFGAGKGYMQPGSMHLGFGNPSVWGAGGSAANAPDWLRSAYYNKAAGAARGGLIDPEELMEGAIPDDEASEEMASLDPRSSSMPRQEMPRQETAIPDGETAIPAPSYDGAEVEVADASDSTKEKPTKDPYELGRRSVRDGLKSAAKSLGLDREGAIDDPQMEKARQNYLRGYGAAPKQMMRQVMDTIDPERKMDPGERSLKAMGQVYQFYMDKGETEKAQQAAQSMLQFYRVEFNKYTALAQTAAQNGDFDNAAKAAAAAYASIPNGRDFSVKPVEGGYEISVKDAKTGKDVTRKVMDPREMAAAAMNFNPGTFDDEILNAAGMPAEKLKDQSPEAMANVEGTVGPSVDAWAEEAGEEDAGRIKTIKNIATSIAGTQIEGKPTMGAEQAVGFATALAKADPKDVSVKPLRGNPDLVTVTVAGQSAVMSKNTAASLKGMQSAKAAADAEAAKPKEPSKVMTNIGKAFDFFKGAVSDELSRDNSERPWVSPSVSGAEQAAPVQGPQQPVPEEQAVPDTAATSASGPGQVIETLLARRKVMENRAKTDPRAADMIRMIDARLKQLGYTSQ